MKNVKRMLLAFMILFAFSTPITAEGTGPEDDHELNSREVLPNGHCGYGGVLC